jgi:hypothetical protein
MLTQTSTDGRTELRSTGRITLWSRVKLREVVHSATPVCISSVGSVHWPASASAARPVDTPRGARRGPGGPVDTTCERDQTAPSYSLSVPRQPRLCGRDLAFTRSGVKKHGPLTTASFLRVRDGGASRYCLLSRTFCQASSPLSKLASEHTTTDASKTTPKPISRHYPTHRSLSPWSRTWCAVAAFQAVASARRFALLPSHTAAVCGLRRH